MRDEESHRGGGVLDQVGAVGEIIREVQRHVRCELPALILRLGKVAAVVVMAHGFRGERRAGAGRQAKEKEKEKRDQWGE